MPVDSTYARFNKKVALWLTANVGTMTCFWIVFALCLSVLPSVLFAMAVIPAHWGFLPVFFTGFGFELLMTWIVSTNFQALCLPAILVGQNFQTVAADIRATKTFEDITVVMDKLDEHTEGGIKVILDRLDALEAPSARSNE